MAHKSAAIAANRTRPKCSHPVNGTSQSKSKCPACAAGAEKTRDGRHHPGFNGKRFYSCRARDERPNYASMRTQAEVDAFEEADIDSRIADAYDAKVADEEAAANLAADAQDEERANAYDCPEGW